MASEATVDAKAAYALVNAEAIIKMASSQSGDDGIDLASKYSIPLNSTSSKSNTRGATATEDTVELTTLEQWYEFYAVRYPSRGFLERQDQLLQLEREKQRQSELLEREKRKQQGGWLIRSLFGWGVGTDDQVTGNTNQENHHDSNNDSSREDFIDDNTNEHDEQLGNNNHDDGMCGTTSSLDLNSIPKEALAFHRFHLVSERRALCAKDHRGHANQWHVVLPIKKFVGTDEDHDENVNGPTYCIVGYGKIAGFPSLPSSSDGEQLLHGGAKVTLTSDRDALCQSLKKHDSLSDLRHTRAAFVGPDCLAVSWGRGDGFVVVYRRVQPQRGVNNRRNKDERILEVGWNAVAVIAPTDAVANEGLNNMTPSPYASGDNEQQEIASLFESGPLRVTDLTPMIVKNDSTNDRAILAISRLGGFIELVTMPNQIWSPSARPPTPPLNQLPNLTGMVDVTAISTRHHHIDIMALDVYRTSIVSSLDWSEEHNQGGAPAEIILASCGRSADTEAEFEIVTLWGITTESQPQPDGRDSDNSSFNVCVSEIKSINIDQLGADSTVFCPGIASDHWTKDVSGIPTNRPRQQDEASCSITVKAPFTSLRFSPRKSDTTPTLLAALDYNGGVTILDSTNAVAFAEQRNKAVESDSSSSFLSILSGRDFSLSTATRKSRDKLFTSQIEWWCPPRSRASHLASFSIVRTKHRTAKAATMKSIIQLHNVCSRTSISKNTITIPVCNNIHSNIVLKRGGTALLPAIHHPLNETLTFVHFSESQQQTNLSVGGVRTILDPSQMITFLLERSDPEKALSVARRFGGAEHFGGNVMNQCRMKLWEDQMDVKALQLVSDGNYVINEAMNLVGLSSQDYTLGGLSLDALLEVYREGLRRCEQKLCAEQGVETDWLSVNASQLRQTILSFGTFQLLLKHFMKGSPHEESFTDELCRRFLNFQRATVVEVAECAAANCDVGALTIIFARHRLSLSERMIILDRIPLSMDLTTFQHLLPCYVDGDSTEGSFLPIKGTQVFMSPLEFFSHLADAQLHGHKTTCEEKVEVFTDDADRKSIVESMGSNEKADSDEGSLVIKDDVAAWYLKRAINLHKENGQIAHFADACEMGLIRLGLISLNRDGECKGIDIPLHAVNEFSGKLYYMHLAAHLLGHISEDKLRELLSLPDIPAETLTSSSTLFRSLPQFCSSGIADTVYYMSQSDDINLSMFDEHLISFMGSDQYFEPSHLCVATNADVISDRVGKDVLKMCISKVKSVRSNNVKCRKRNNMNCGDAVVTSFRLENALCTCLHFASLGSNTASSSICVIRNDNDLIDFFEEVFRSVVIVVDDDWDLITDSLLQTLWSLFELLPFDGSETEERESGNRLIGLMYFKLVALQLFRKWRCYDALPLTLKTFVRSQSSREIVTTSNDCKQHISSVGYDLVAFMCGSFSAQLARGCDENLLFDFISDTEELDQRFFSGTIQSSGSLGRLLVPSLLKLQSFETLREVLKLQQQWFDEHHACGVIRSFVIDRMSSDLTVGYGGEAAAVGLRCMKTIGPLFPQLSDVFEHQHRLFDAKNFTSDTMHISNDVIAKVFDISHSNVVMIECLVQECPQSLLMGCEFWGDIGRSKNACVDALQYFSFQIETAVSKGPISDSALVLPPMPGGLVMQLANILGINTPFETLVAKKIMLMGSLRKSLVHAAVAICYSMLADAAFTDDYTDIYRSELLSCIDAILLDQTFVNSVIKKELCIQSVKLLSVSVTSSFDTLLETLYNLEYESLMNWEQDSSERDRGVLHDSSFLERVAKQARDLTATNDQNVSSLPGRSKNVFTDGGLNCLFHEIKEATSTDLLPLLCSFHEGVVPNKSSLEVICRTVLSWISSEALMDKISAAESTMSNYNVIVMIELVSCCLNELDNDTSFAIISHAVEAFESTVVRGYSSTTAQIYPDEAIVERLNGRGYGWNASRRAAIMTKNQGYSEALAWAVSHFQDDDFDSPLYFLQDESTPRRIEESMVQNIKKLLGAMQGSVRRPATNGHPSLTFAKKGDSNDESNGNSSSRTDFLGTETAAQSIRVTRGGSGNSNGISIAREKTPPPPPPPPLPTVLRSQKMDVTGGVDNCAIVKKKEAKALVSSPLEETLSSVEGSIGSRSSIKKQVSRGGTTLGTQKLSLEERKKL